LLRRLLPHGTHLGLRRVGRKPLLGSMYSRRSIRKAFFKCLSIRSVSYPGRFPGSFRWNSARPPDSKSISAFRRAGIPVYKQMKLMNGYFALFRRFLITPDSEKEGFLYIGKVGVIARFGTEILDPAAHPVSSVGFRPTIFHLSTPTREGGRNRCLMKSTSKNT